MLIARLRRAAITWGPWPVLTCDRSSLNVTSLAQCSLCRSSSVRGPKRRAVDRDQDPPDRQHIRCPPAHSQSRPVLGRQVRGPLDDRRIGPGAAQRRAHRNRQRRGEPVPHVPTGGRIGNRRQRIQHPRVVTGNDHHRCPHRQRPWRGHGQRVGLRAKMTWRARLSGDHEVSTTPSSPVGSCLPRNQPPSACHPVTGGHQRLRKDPGPVPHPLRNPRTHKRGRGVAIPSERGDVIYAARCSTGGAVVIKRS